VSDLPREDFQYLLHELQVHQAELSIQNEELRRVQLELETARDLYADLYHLAPVGYCTLSRKDTILEANQTMAVLLGVNRDELLHQPLSQFVDRADQDQYYLHRQRAFEEHQRQISKINMVKQSGEKILIRLESLIAAEDENRLRVMLSDITEQERIEKEAQEAASLRELRKRVNEQREQERQQMARDLHDGPVQGLVAITFALRGMLMDHPYTELAPQLEAIQSDLQEQISELRTYAMELRPPMLARFGLEKTIRSYAEIFQEKHPVIRIQLGLQHTGTLLDETVSLALFRIYQEALNNIRKHVQRPAILVCVRLQKDEKQVRLEIQDNGGGFTLPEEWIDLVREGHLGLVGMRERAEAVGGQFEIYPQPGEGTRLVVRVPLEQARKAE
jgi:PAS domain S-box-containing protein